MANIDLVFKKDKKEEILNYTVVSLDSVSCKIMMGIIPRVSSKTAEEKII